MLTTGSAEVCEKLSEVLGVTHLPYASGVAPEVRELITSWQSTPTLQFQETQGTRICTF
jgi:hypothetical protein